MNTRKTRFSTERERGRKEILVRNVGGWGDSKREINFEQREIAVTIRIQAASGSRIRYNGFDGPFLTSQ
jgi:hypothetical protein